jgi:hypothetical protein
MSTTAKHLNTGGSPAPRGWLSSFLRDLSGESAQAHRRRLVLSAAAALALIEIATVCIPSHTYTITQQPTERITIAKLTRIEHRVVHTPKPKPTPKPIVHTKVIAETHTKPTIVNPGAPAQHQRVHRIASARPIAHTRYHSKPATIHVPTGGHGAGTSKTAQALTGGTGPGGTGTGQSGSGQGTGGAPQAHEPCGYVEFIPTGNPQIDKSTGRVWEYIEMIVHFPDGTQQSVDLDYPWYYPTQDADPWSAANEKANPDAPVPFQFPPPAQRPNEPAVVEYVIQHTTSEGLTLLHECPR